MEGHAARGVVCIGACAEDAVGNSVVVCEHTGLLCAERHVARNHEDGVVDDELMGLFGGGE